jgi:hypothetical protein
MSLLNTVEQLCGQARIPKYNSETHVRCRSSSSVRRWSCCDPSHGLLPRNHGESSSLRSLLSRKVPASPESCIFFRRNTASSPSLLDKKRVELVRRPNPSIDTRVELIPRPNPAIDTPAWNGPENRLFSHRECMVLRTSSFGNIIVTVARTRSCFLYVSMIRCQTYSRLVAVCTSAWYWISSFAHNEKRMMNYEWIRRRQQIGRWCQAMLLRKGESKPLHKCISPFLAISPQTNKAERMRARGGGRRGGVLP